MPPDQPPPKNYVRDDHVGERVEDLRLIIGLGAPVFFLLVVGEIILRARGSINTPVLVLLMPANVLIILGMVRIIQAFSGTAADALAKTVYGAGNLPPEPGFSSEEAMIMQGRLDDAEASLRQRFTDHPDLHQAGLRLGALLVQVGRPEEAEQVYLEMRRRTLPANAAMIVANRLIDLYERTDRKDRLKVELARFSGEWKGTGAGEHAARRLRELKDEERERDERAED